MTQFRRFAESVTNSNLENSFKSTRIRITFFVGSLLAVILFLSGITSFHQHKYVFEKSVAYQISTRIALQPLEDLPASIRQDIKNFEDKKTEYLKAIAAKITTNNSVLWGLLTLFTWLSLYYLLRPLQDAITEKEQFLDSASHELRTPLAVMKSELSLANETDEQKDLLDTIETVKMQVNKLAVLSDTLLNRLEGAKNVIDVNLNKTLDKTFKSLGHKKGVLDNKVNKNASFKLNEGIFEQLIYNILDNALKYADSKKINAFFKDGTLIVSNTVKENYNFLPGVGIGVQKELARALGVGLKHEILDGKFLVKISF